MAVKCTKPREKSYMLRDDRGLYLRVDPSGHKYWILRYWEGGKEHRLSLGAYPTISLKLARARRDEIQTNRAQGISPRRDVQVPTFKQTAAEWFDVRVRGLSPGYQKSITLRLQKWVLPLLGHMPVKDITSGEVLRVCRRIEAAGHVETAHRVKVLIGQVLRFAIAAGHIETDPTLAITGALQPRSNRHMATFTNHEQVRVLYQAMLGYPWPVLRAALLFSILTFARPGEVRQAEWREIQGDTWDIPAEKMKMRRRHLIPLSSQAREVLAELRELTGGGRYIFPNSRGNGKPMSENAVRMALRGMGYTKDQLTPHGFRAMASTILNEHGFNRDAIERQLAHVEANQVRGAYNHAEYLEERRRILQWWADFLEGKEGGQ